MRLSTTRSWSRRSTKVRQIARYHRLIPVTRVSTFRGASNLRHVKMKNTHPIHCGLLFFPAIPLQLHFSCELFFLTRSRKKELRPASQPTRDRCTKPKIFYGKIFRFDEKKNCLNKFLDFELCAFFFFLSVEFEHKFKSRLHKFIITINIFPLRKKNSFLLIEANHQIFYLFV